MFMRRMFNVICLGFALLGMAPVVHADAQFPIEAENTRVRFECSGGILPVVGRFEAVQGRSFFSSNRPNRGRSRSPSDSKSLTTGHAAMDRQLDTPDFFDSARYPAIVFESTDVRETGAGKARPSRTAHRERRAARPVTLHVALDPQPIDELSHLGREATSTDELAIPGVGPNPPQRIRNGRLQSPHQRSMFAFRSGWPFQPGG